MSNERENWDLIIKPRSSLFNIGLRQLWRYRDLLFLFVRRDIVAFWKQTILGPLWFVLQPLLTALTYFIVFTNIASISTDGVPPFLFYMSGIVMWNYFSECLMKTSETFTSNAGIFGKVYFPRLIVPLSIVFSNLVRFFIQFLLLIACWIYYYFHDASSVHLNAVILLLPVLVLLMAGHGLAMGIIISSLTTKYRDLRFLIQFGVQLLMYATPIVYPLSSVPEKARWVLLLNPMTSITEAFKYGFFGKGVFDPLHLGYSFLLFLVMLFFGLLLFNKVEKSFMDTI